VAQQPPTRELFSSRWVFLVAAVGAAVGLGNIWRFPFIAGANGGGAFLIAYAVCMAAVAMPMVAIELATGRTAGAGIVAALGRAGRWARYAGFAVAAASTVVVGYYLVVTGWTIGYTVHAVRADLPGFAEFTDGYASLWWFLGATAVCLAVVLRGIKGGIEVASKALTPLLLVIMVSLAFYAPTIDEFGDAIEFYLVPDREALLEAETWVAALGQVFFSVGVGMGVLVTYGAYVGARENLAASAIAITLADAAVAFLAGFVVFPLAFSLGESPAAGPELAFNALPEAFRLLGTAGNFVAVLFYVSLSAAALTSAIALLEVGVVALRELFGLSRRTGTAILALPVFAVGTWSALSYASPEWTLAGDPVLDQLNEFVGDLGLPLGVLATSLIAGWWVPQLIRDGIPVPALAARTTVLAARWLVPAAVVATMLSQLA
jgi:NSS family neurotransmitter:Na+ symporter